MTLQVKLAHAAIYGVLRLFLYGNGVARSGDKIDHIARTLTSIDDAGRMEVLREDELAALAAPFVVLGDPGMGKTSLLRQLCQHPTHHFLTAGQFMRTPLSKLPKDRILVIDALDERSASRDGDALDLLLERLGEAGYPPFILSCRIADWNGSSGARDIGDDYGCNVREFTLAPLTDEEALGLLRRKLGRTAADHFYWGLRDHDLDALLHNPQTLAMLAEIAPEGVPKGRADLFERAARRTLAEHNDAHSARALNRTTTEGLLDAAGAAMAMLILTGGEAVGTGLQGIAPAHLVNIADIASLPLGGDIEAVIHSRLFRGAGEAGGFVEGHRTIAEYLAARWLARLVDRAERPSEMVVRILSLIHSNGRVPASVRGLHAWLAYWSPQLAGRVIAADPYGVIRYGDVGAADIAEADRIWHALAALAERDPWFRAGDFHPFTVASLTQAGMGPRLAAILGAPDDSGHLVSLLLDILPGGACIPEIYDALLRVLRDRRCSFSDRRDAARILSASSGHGIAWPKLLIELCAEGEGNGIRLAEETLSDLDLSGISDAEIADIVFRCCDGHSSIGGVPGHSRHSREFLGLEAMVPVERCATLLDALVDRFAGTTSKPALGREFGFCRLVHSLVLRQLPSGTPDAVRLWRWLDAFEGRWHADQCLRDVLAGWFDGNDMLRRAVQRHVLFSDEGVASRERRHWFLANLSRGLLLTDADAQSLLSHLLAEQRRDARAVDVFGLLKRGWHGDPWSDELAALAAQFAEGHPQLTAILHPPPSPVDEENRRIVARMAAEQARSERRIAERFRADRVRLEAQADVLRHGGGDLEELAIQYLGHGEVARQKDPVDERIGMWVGEALHGIALEGFETCLHRPLGCTLHELHRELIENRHGRRELWPIVAGLAERFRTGRGFAALSEDIVLGGLIVHRDGISVVDDHLRGFGDALEAYAASSPARWERYLRALVEPGIAAGEKYVAGLHHLTHARRFPDVAARLLLEWLDDIWDQISDRKAVAGGLLDVPLSARNAALGRISALVADAFRAGEPEENLFWWSLRFLVDFDAHRATLERLAAREPEFLWEVAKTIGYSRYNDRELRPVRLDQLAWIFDHFHLNWPETEHPGQSRGRRQPWEASNFLRAMLFRIASDTSAPAMQLLHDMTETGSPTYGEALRAARARQRAKAADLAYAPPTLAALASAVSERAPQSASEVRAIIVEALEALQRRVRGSATETRGHFYRDGRPLGEGACRNLTLDLLGANLPFGIMAAPEELMPGGKRADAGFRLGSLRVPLEAKLHWNRDLWTAAERQLDRFYASADHMADGQGIFLIFWFGAAAPRAMPSVGGRRPGSAAELTAMVEADLPAALRDRIAVFVLDLAVPEDRSSTLPTSVADD